MSVAVPAERFLPVALVEARSRRQRIALLSAVGAVATFLLLRAGASLVLDRWWFDSVTSAPVWRVKLTAQAQVGLGTGAVVALVLGGSVWYVWRVGRIQEPSTNGVIRRYHQRMGPAHLWLLVGTAAYFSYHIAVAATSSWDLWLLFQNADELGRSAPVDGRDIGYHLFRLPFLVAASSFLRQLVVFAIGVSVFGHAMSGALRWPGGGRRSSSLAVAHLVALGTFACVLQALHDMFVARPSIATNRVGSFDGPGYTEEHVTRPGLFAAALAVAVVGFVVIWCGRTRRWRALVVAAGVALVVHGAVVVVLPALSERFIVAPAEAARQLWSIDNNLQATNEAYGLVDVTTTEVVLDDLVARSEIDAGASDIARVPLFDVATLAPTLQVLAGTAGSRIIDVDAMEYMVDDQDVPVFVAARSARRDDIPERGWVQEHLVYTHGDGVVVAPADRTDADGRPDTTSLIDDFGVERVPLYFGEQLDGWYSLVATKRTQQGGTEFEGQGIDMSSRFARLALALTVGESQPFLTAETTEDTQLLYRRSVRERVGSLAPFLALDGDPYPVLADGRVVWVVDGYTTSSTFPAAQFTKVSGVPTSSDLAGREINYLRASVKATVDAETGETHLYRNDGGTDPIIDVWDGVFPGLLEPIEAFPAELAPHVRYPDDLWTVQTSLVGRYHVETAEELFNGTGRWAISAAAAPTVGEPTTAPAPSVDIFTPLSDPVGRFATVRPLGPGSGSDTRTTRDELSAFVVAEHGLGGAIDLVVPATGDGPPLLSPQVAQSAIDADPDLARVITLLNANGSKVQFGPMTPTVSARGLIWTRPIVVVGTGSAAAPRLYGVAAVFNGQVALRSSTAEAVEAVENPLAPTVLPAEDVTT